jgi:hypothetical protein
MARKERESKNEIAGFRGLKPPIPAISNAAKSEKQTPAQSLRALFTDDKKFVRDKTSAPARASVLFSTGLRIPEEYGVPILEPHPNLPPRRSTPNLQSYV